MDIDRHGSIYGVRKFREGQQQEQFHGHGDVTQQGPIGPDGWMRKIDGNLQGKTAYTGQP